MRRHILYLIGSVFVWVGSIAIVASFLTKMIFQFATLAPYSPYFFAFILAGIGLMFLARV